jgi:hypothetical protein
MDTSKKEEDRKTGRYTRVDGFRDTMAGRRIADGERGMGIR